MKIETTRFELDGGRRTKTMKAANRSKKRGTPAKHEAAPQRTDNKSQQPAAPLLRVHRAYDSTAARAKVTSVPRHLKSDVHYVFGASTKHFDIFWPSSFKTKGKGQAIAESIARHCETDFNIISGYFLDTKIDHFNVYILGNRKAGSFHYGCGGTDLYVDPDAPHLGLVAEMVEVFEDAYGHGWDCGASNGEGLSRVLSEALHPAEVDLGGLTYSSGFAWLNGIRLDYVDQTEGSDQDFVSIGCATLFLNWLRFQHGYKWEQIIQSGGFSGGPLPIEYVGTLGATFKNLTKRSDGYTQFLTFMNTHFPIIQQVPRGIASDTPFPFPASSQWHDWENLGGTLTSSPTVASRARGSMDCFMRSKDGDLDWKSLDGSDVFDSNLGHPQSGKFKGAPAAISWRYERLDMFVCGSDDALWHRRFSLFMLPPFNDWQKLDLQIADAPAVASWAPNRLDVFTRSSNGEIIHTFSDGGSDFTVGRNLGHPKDLPFEGAPAAVSRRPGTIDVFARGGDHTIWRIVFDGENWRNWQKVAEDFTDGPAVASWAPHRVDLFGRNSHGELIHKHSDDELHFTGTNNLGQPSTGPLKGSPAAVSMKPNQLDVFVRGADDALWHKSWG